MSELKFRKTPSSLRQLQRPWFPKKDNPRVEGMIRFGSRIERHYPDKAPYIKHWVSGGAGTSFEDSDSRDPKLIRSFLELSKGQYHKVVDKEKSEHMREKLKLFLEERGVELVSQGGRSIPLMNHNISLEMIQLLSLLPESHFGHGHFTRFRLGGWGGGAAKCSEYKDPEVRIFQFATGGPIRNLYALMLHEIGHSFAANLPIEYLDALEKARVKLTQTRKIYGVDYLFGPQERQNHCLSCLKEFVPELYLMYVTQGAFTKEGLDVAEQSSNIHSYLENLSPNDRRLLTAIWSLYRKCFEGIEYV
jgi:hypothetical protein